MVTRTARMALAAFVWLYCFCSLVPAVKVSSLGGGFLSPACVHVVTLSRVTCALGRGSGFLTLSIRREGSFLFE